MDSIERTVLEALDCLEKRQSNLEMELSVLLNANYCWFDESTKDECIRKIEEYMQMTTSVTHDDVVFIKKLTKVAYHLLLEEKKQGKPPAIGFTDFADRLYSFNLEGIAKCLSRDEDLEEYNYLILEAHFHSYAGDALKFKANDNRLPRNTRFDLEKGCYEHYLEYANIIKNLKPREFAYANRFAGEAIFTAVGFIDRKDNEKREKYLLDAYDCFRKSADALVKYNPKHAAFEYAHAADALESFSDLQLLKNAYQCNISSAMIMDRINVEFSAHRNRCAGNVAMKLAGFYDCPGTESEAFRYLEKAKRHFNRFLDFYKDRTYGQYPRLLRECRECIDVINESSDLMKQRKASCN